MVRRRHAAKRCTRPRGRSLQEAQRQAGCAVAETVGRNDSAAQVESIQVCHVDAQFRDQPWGQESLARAAESFESGESGASKSLSPRGRSRVTFVSKPRARLAELPAVG